MTRPCLPANARRRFLGDVAAAAAAVGGLAGPGRALGAGVVTIFAAASLADVLGSLATRVSRSGPLLRLSFAASSTLARQIEQGAAADLFVSADEAWMDHLAEKGRIVAESRRDLVSNRLVVVRAGMPVQIEPSESTPDLRHALLVPGAVGAGRISTGDPAHVPAGRYAQAALTRLGLWAEVEPRLARADNVRSALAFVERGEAAAGIVYATDARLSGRVRTVARFPEASHPPIRYPVALVTGHVAAARLVWDELFTPVARAAFRVAGFGEP